MAKFLVTFSDVLNDVEINGFGLMTDKEVDNFENLANSIAWEFSYKLTDAEIFFLNGEDLISKLDFKEISNDEFKVLKKLFKDKFGTFVDEAYLEGIIGDEDSEVEDLYEDINDEDDFTDEPKRSSKYRDRYEDDDY